MKKLFSLVLSLCILAGCLCLPISAFAAAPTLSSLELSADGVTYESVEGFNAERLTYYYKCRGEVLPTVRATAASKDATVTVHQAGKYYRTAEIIVSEGGQDTTYEVVFLQNLSHLDGVTATANLGYQSNPASMAIDGVYTATSSWLYSTTATEKGVFNLDLGAVYDVYDISIVYNYNVGNDAENHDIIYSSTTGTEDADYGDPIGVTSTDKGEFNEVADAANVDWFDLTLDKDVPFKARYFKFTGSAEKGAIGYSEVEVWGLGEQYPTALEDIRISEDGGATYTSFADYNPATNTYYYKCGRTADDSGNILPLVQAIAADGTTATVLQASEGIRNAKITVKSGAETTTYTIYFLINLSREAGATANATLSTWSNNKPIKTIDGDLTTYWSYTVPSPATQQSIWVDLGASYQVYEISALIITGHATSGSENVDDLTIKNTAATAATDADWTTPTATFAENTNPPSVENLEEYDHTLSDLTTLRSVKISGSATTGSRGIRELQIWGLPAQAADNDASLSNISLSTNGRTYENIADFDSEKDTYTHYCQDFSTFENGGNYPLTSNIPSVKAAASHRDARVAITQATAGDATATIVVTAPDGVTQKTYKVLMVSDVASTSTVTVGASYSGGRPYKAIDRDITTYWQAGSTAGGHLLTINFGTAKTITGFDFYVHSNSKSTTHWDVVTIDTDTSTDVAVSLGTITSTAVGSKYKVSCRFTTPVTATKLKVKGTVSSAGRHLYEAIVWGNSSRNAIYQDAEHNFYATLNWASAKSETGTLYWGWYDSQGNLLKIGKIANPVAVAPGTGESSTANTSTNAAASGTNVNASLGKAPEGAATIRFFFWNGDIQPVETTLWIGL